MWSVNLDESIAGLYRTLGQHSGRASGSLWFLMAGTGVRWEWLWLVWKHICPAENALVAPRSTWERRRQDWEHLESQQSSLGLTSLGLLLVRLEIIATTYCSTIDKTLVFRLYSHPRIYVSTYICIYIATHLHTIYLDWLQAVLGGNSRCPWKWWSSELRDTLWGHDWASLEMHMEAVIEHIWRYT